MRSSTRAIAIGLAVGALLVTGGPAQAQAGWTTVASPSQPGRNFLQAADASDASHVWAVGRWAARVTSRLQSLVLRYDGTAWRLAPLSGFGGNDGLYAVDAVSASEAWAAGTSSGPGRTSTLVVRWNGSTWAPEVTPNGPSSTNQLQGVAAAGSTVWAVGHYIVSGSSYNHRALILQRTGGAWRVSAAPQVQGNEFLLAVDATGPTDAWAVGWGSPGITSGPGVPIALRWNGSSWRSMPPPSTATTELTAVDALTPGNVWVAGQTLNGSTWQPYVAQFNGTSWRRIATPTLDSGARLTDLVALSASNVVAVGTSSGTGIPLVLRWNGSSWSREAPAPSGNLTGAAAVGTTVWAVGNQFALNAYEERTLTTVRN